jgi:hypothetical protein
MFVVNREDFEKLHDQTIGHHTTEISENNLEFPKLFYKINGLDVYNTFDYIYKKIQKGIFLKFNEKEIQMMVFCSKEKNEWGHLIQAPSNLKRLSKFNIHLNTHYWQTNNGVMRYENPHIEHFNNLEILKDMFQELAKTRNIPKGLEIFVNKRDFPIVTKDAQYEPYYNIYGKNYKLVGKELISMAPIVSFSKRDGFDDILIPNYEDWKRVSKPCSFQHIPWCEKKNQAVFRGSSTGGLTDNIRLKLCSMKHFLLDVGITKLNNRLLAENNKIDFLNYQGPIVPKLTFQQQLHYKMIIHVEGHVSAFRLGLEMASKSCLLIVDGPWYTWFKPQPFVHYLPIKRDLSNLIEVINWCLENDEKAKQIAENAYTFYESHLTKCKMLDFLENTFQNLSKHVGSYRYAPIKWNMYIEQTLPKFHSYNDWFHENVMESNLNTLHFKDQLQIFFQILVKFQYLQWHYCAFLEDFKINIEFFEKPKNLSFNELYDHFFYNTKINVHIGSKSIKYVKDNITNYWEIKHNLYDILNLFKHPIIKSIIIPEDISFKEGIKIIYSKYYQLHSDSINYKRKLPTPLIKSTINATPDLDHFYKYPFPSTFTTNKLIIYRQLQICEEWCNKEILDIFKNLISKCKPNKIIFNRYDVELPKNINSLTLQYNYPVEFSFPSPLLSNDTIYIRLIFELLYNNKFMMPEDKSFYINLFKPLLELDKVEYSIKLARLQTVLKYNSIHQ